MKKIRRFNGDDDSYVEGTASSLRDDANDADTQSRQDQTERMAKLADSTESSSRETPAVTPVAAPKTKPAIVTKEQLQAFKAKYGADKDLTDYMNAQAGGLKRRNAPPPKVRETTVEDVFPVLTGEKKRAEEKMDKKQARAEANAQLIAKVKAGKDPRAILYPYSSTPGIEHAKPKEKEKETRTPKRAGNLTDMFGLSSKYASGGSVSSRADGIAQRGKTRGKMC
jgi:hypothetical protein